MGWTFTRRSRGMSHKEFFSREFAETGRDPILAIAATLNEVYMAYQLKDGRVLGVVCLIKWVPKDRFNFGWKDMDESMGPCACNCPARILDLLTDPPSNEWAAEWRAKCRANLARKAETNKVKVEIGTHFTYGSYRYKVLGPWGSRSLTVKNLDNGMNYTIRRATARKALLAEQDNRGVVCVE